MGKHSRPVGHLPPKNIRKEPEPVKRACIRCKDGYVEGRYICCKRLLYGEDVIGLAEDRNLWTCDHQKYSQQTRHRK